MPRFHISTGSLTVDVVPFAYDWRDYAGGKLGEFPLSVADPFGKRRGYFGGG